MYVKCAANSLFLACPLRLGLSPLPTPSPSTRAVQPGKRLTHSLNKIFRKLSFKQSDKKNKLGECVERNVNFYWCKCVVNM